MSKLAAILKPRTDGSLKVRLVIDYRRSGVNAFVKTRERVVLPRAREAIDNAVFMMKEHGGNAQLAWMVVDFKDAFHTIPVDPEDLRLQVFMTRPGVFELFSTTVFGSKASPLIWGRFGALLMRSGQSLFGTTELLLECYVDDPIVAIKGRRMCGGTWRRCWSHGGALSAHPCHGRRWTWGAHWCGSAPSSR